MNDLILSAATRVSLAVQNPLDGIIPDFSFGGTEFTALWQKVVAAVWGAGILISIVYVIIGVVGMAGASGDVNPNPQQHAVGRKKAMWALISLGALAALALIVGAVLTFAN